MKTFKRIDLTPNKQGYTLERHPTKKQKVGKTELNYDTDDINCGKTGESKSFRELIKSLTPACDSSESDDDFDKVFQTLIIAFSRYEGTHPNLVSQASQAREIEIFCGLQIGRPSRLLLGLWACLLGRYSLSFPENLGFLASMTPT